MRRVAMVCLVGLLSLSLGQAHAGRPDKSWKSWFGHVAAGWGFQQGDASDILDDDFYLNGGATYWPETWPVGIVLDLGLSSYDFSRETIDGINDALEDDGQERAITGGDAEIWALTANGIWSPGSGGLGFYLTGGIGAYYLDAKLTTDALVYYPPICNPWYWWCSPGGVGPGTAVVTSDSTTEFGWNVGVGLDFEVGSSGSQVFVELKYHSFDLDRATTSFVPLVVGYRW